MKVRINQQHETTTYYGHGKLLITAEYFVLDGAQALAVPTRLGQSLRVKVLHSSEGLLYWVALNSQGQIWLNLVFDTATFNCLNADIPEAQRLTSLLTATRELNPSFLTDTQDRAIETHLEFPNAWGLGSSSTLVHNLATWAQVDGYQLLRKTIGGSGYDVACAAHHSPILYRLQHGQPETQPVRWHPPFADQLYFVYLGKKQLSAEGIKYYREKLADKTHVVNALTRITTQMLRCTSLDEFEQLLNEHEHIVGDALKMMKVKDELFADYPGSVKSLGAWGGDFVLMSHAGSRDELQHYLQQKEMPVLFRYDELILQ